MDLFKEYMNSRHSSMEFTSELEDNGVLSFLDISISSVDGQFCTSLYRKPTFSGVYSNFSSFTPDSFKFGLVMCLLYRAFNLSSSYALFHEEVVRLKSILARNAYPRALIDCCISKFLNNVHRVKLPVCPMVERKSVFIVLPYLGLTSIQIRRKIMLLCKRHLPQVDCRVVLKPCFRMSNLFPFKDKIPFELRSNIVYQFKCVGCSTAYYGLTTRHIKTRLSEHLGISSLTGKPVCCGPSAVFDHCVFGPAHKFCVSPPNCVECCNNTAKSFSILTSASSEFHLKIKESLLIARDRPVLNKNVASLPLYLF